MTRRMRRKRRYTRRRSGQRGGKFIAAGSYGGVFGGEGGPLPCKGEEKTDHTIITKLLRKKDADNEFSQKKHLEKVDPDQTFLLYPLAEPCDIKPYHELTHEQQKWVDIYDEKSKGYPKINTHLDKYKLVKYKYGGVELGNDYVKTVPILKFLEKYLDLMKGVLKLHNNNMFHCDIKIANILIDPSDNTIRLVDFGFMHIRYGNQFLKIIDDDLLKNVYEYWPFYLNYLYYDKRTKIHNDESLYNMFITRQSQKIKDQLEKFYKNLEHFTTRYPILHKVFENLNIKYVKEQLKILHEYVSEQIHAAAQNLGIEYVIHQYIKSIILKGIDMFGLGLALVEVLYKHYKYIPGPIENVILDLMSQNLIFILENDHEDSPLLHRYINNFEKAISLLREEKDT